MRSRAVYGCAGHILRPDERAFFERVKPWGFILFGRNISSPEQIAGLTQSLREAVDDAIAPVLIDQEGGRVARLSPPVWSARPAAARLGDLFARAPELGREAAYLNARLMAHDLKAVGINVDCAPVLDTPVASAHDIIGDRAFGHDLATIIELGRAVIDGLMDGGVLPVMKHIPGHGRVMADSHRELPRVSSGAEELSSTDFVPFRSLNQCPMAMTAHVVFESIDSQRPATTSPKVIREIVRGQIGFDGLLISDDVSMSALSGPISTRARAALFAGCDIVLHCNGSMEEMVDVAREATLLEGQVLKRAEHALSEIRQVEALDVEAAQTRLNQLMEGSR